MADPSNQIHNCRIQASYFIIVCYIGIFPDCSPSLGNRQISLHGPRGVGEGSVLVLLRLCNHSRLIPA